MNSRNNNMRCYILSLQTILLLASTPFGLCDSVKKPHGLVLHNHLLLQLTEAKTPVNNPPYCIYPPPPPLGSVTSPSTQTPPYYAPKPPAIIPPPMTHPSAPIPPYKKPENAVWCVAKPTVPEVLLQQAMDYACGSGAGCEAIEQNGVCFQPNTVLSHASYAFNSYWQKTKQAGGTCEFGGVAMLVTVDPSYNECHFIYV
ncbi:glucan endo-1,3-beta-D-glucosidase [Nicotiana tabacum]|uniref:Glucan endo-1,3-beta-D-glucosidase n=2 Tax=Nicotiana TaxID=4085 RepID=A0A1S4AI54_TOBAC|nr:PREDICTED: major pollen allergen Ole e 10-like [Nicotiana sylvestris]XP_009793745.1 PREDICTED: major pollen allergen Ole e 10-like [Nicotiana sylvestris]XP_016476336.1 PREDICTED: major pollen allergen Ole e 10-like [Nicotiana tabacum]